MYRRGAVLVAASLTGIAEATRDISAAHAASRFQFDRPIGVNQAIKHPCADMAVRAELAWAQTLFAALATDERRQDAEFHAIGAKVVAADAAERNVAATVQVLGGMGFTFEHDANLYVKRAHVRGTRSATPATRCLGSSVSRQPCDGAAGSGQAGRNTGAVMSSVSDRKSTTRSIPMRRSAGSQSTMFVITRGPSSRSTTAAT